MDCVLNLRFCQLLNNSLLSDCLNTHMTDNVKKTTIKVIFGFTFILWYCASVLTPELELFPLNYNYINL